MDLSALLPVIDETVALDRLRSRMFAGAELLRQRSPGHSPSSFSLDGLPIVSVFGLAIRNGRHPETSERLVEREEVDAGKLSRFAL